MMIDQIFKGFPYEFWLYVVIVLGMKLIVH